MFKTAVNFWVRSLVVTIISILSLSLGIWGLTVAFNKGTYADIDPVSGLEFTFHDNGEDDYYSVTSSGSFAGTNLVIPSTFNGLPVRIIDDNAFDNEPYISVVIPNSVISIGFQSFSNCSALTDIVIPESVISIGTEAFASCGLTNLTIPNSVTSIGIFAFYGCSGLTSVTLPSNVNFTTIPNSAFVNCTNLSEIKIPNNVTIIGDEAFHNCVSLTSVVIANSVTDIGYMAFANTHADLEVTVFASSPANLGTEVFGSGSGSANLKINVFYTRLSAFTSSWGQYSSKIYSIDDDGITYTYDSNAGGGSIPGYIASGVSVTETAIEILPYWDDGIVGHETLPVYQVAIGGFLDNVMIDSVFIPSSIRQINADAFRGCTGLTSVTFEEGSELNTIGSNAFMALQQLSREYFMLALI